MSFARRCTAVINHNQIPSTQSNLPICLVVTDPELKQLASGGYMNNAAAYDTGISVDGGVTWTQPFEIESYDSATPKLVIWTTPASLSASVDGSFILGFGDPALNTNPSSTSVWTGYEMVQHLPNGTTLTANDSTANAHNGTLVNTPTATAAQIGGGANFVASSSQNITIPAISALGSASKAVLKGWLKRAASSNNIAFGMDVVAETNELFIAAFSDGQIYILAGGAYYGFFASNDTALHRVTLVFDGTQTGNARLTAYFDGAPKALTYSGTAPATLPASPTTFYIGRDVGDGVYSSGKADEIQLIVGATTSADLETAECNNQSNPSAGGFYVSTTFAANGTRRIPGLLPMFE